MCECTQYCEEESSSAWVRNVMTSVSLMEKVRVLTVMRTST